MVGRTTPRLAGTTSVAAYAALAALAGGLAAVRPLAAILPVAVIGLVACWSSVLSFSKKSAWAVPAVIPIVAILFDFRGLASSDGPVRYLATAIVAGVVLLLREPGLIGARAICVTAGILFVYGVVGTLFGRIAYGTPDGALPLAAPLLLIVLGPVHIPTGDAATVRALKLLSLLSATYAAASAVSYATLNQVTAPVYNHEKAFLVVLAIGTAMAARSTLLTAYSVFTAALAFAAYPAATWVAAGAAGLLTVVVVRVGMGRLARLATAAVILPGTLIAVLHIDSLITFTAGYFEAVGKTDNGSTRVSLYRLALDQIDKSPWVSDLFTGNLTVTTTLSGRTGVVLPVHNDYLSAALGGGIVAAGLFIGIFLFTNGLALRTLATVSQVQQRAIVALLACLNAATLTAFANPVFMNPGSSVAVYSILIGLISLCVKRKARPRGSNSSVVITSPLGADPSTKVLAPQAKGRQ